MYRELRTAIGLTLVTAIFFAANIDEPTRAEEKDASLERTRAQVKMLDDLYKSAVISITSKYVNKQDETPAAAVAKDVFEYMQDKGWHKTRLLDATGRPMRKANVAKTDFEKKAVAAIKAGKPYFEEIDQADGKRVLRAATVVPAVMQQCVECHPHVKKGEVLGVLSYEVLIK